MAKSAEEYSRQMRAQLKVLDPDLSLDPLTPERKIIDTVADVLADADIDRYVLDYQFDIDAKFGADLDRFIALFGFARQGGRRAVGTITFSRGTATDRDIFVPAGTQVIKPATIVSPAVIFQTTASTTMYAATTEAEAPIECTVEGEVGNVAGGTITAFGGAGASELGTVTNQNATTGGSAAESDATLKVRFRNTIFRNVAGTKDQFLALAIASRFANKANVIGPVSRFIEYVQMANDTPSAGQTGAISQIPYSKHTYNFDYYLTDGDIGSEEFFTPNGVDYTFNNTIPPSIRALNTTLLPAGNIVLFEHSYCSANSRNDPANNVLNYVDIFVSGSDDTIATESTSFPTSANNIVNNSSTKFHFDHWRRYETNATPVVGSRFQELLWQPAILLPEVITIGDKTFREGSDFFLLRDTRIEKGSRRARNGIEWVATAVAGITAGTEFTLTYTFDKLPLTLNELMEAHKQVTTDVLVHSATERFFIVRLIIMYTPGFSREAVDEAIRIALANFLERLQFGAVIQISDILDIVHDVPGVDNVRLALPGDGVPYGIQEVAMDGATPIDVPITNDFAIQDSDLPVLQGIVTTQRSQNTWG